MVEAASIKAPDAFRTISEVAQDLELPQHVLRFWETRFGQIKPMKRGGGRRYYRPEDVDLLRGIRLLLYGQGFTIRGVQRLLKDKGVAFVVSVGQTGSVQTVTAIEADDIDDAPAPPRRASARIEPSIEAAYEPEDHATEIAVDSRATPSAPQNMPVIASMAVDQRRRLESALSELVEAKELLEQAR
jgi:DNA-binding transcriptional MerR regulator